MSAWMLIVWEIGQGIESARGDPQGVGTLRLGRRTSIADSYIVVRLQESGSAVCCRVKLRDRACGGLPFPSEAEQVIIRQDSPGGDVLRQLGVE
jgi:hypothetical protein